MRLSFILGLAGLIFLVGCSPKTNGTVVLIETNFGDMKIRLYDETPIHRDNFVKLTKEGYLDSCLFHRVINEFMIQGGDPDSKNAEPGASLGNGGPDYTLPAEIDFPNSYHKKGVLAAAREGDKENPQKRSSGSQFYIVQGKIFNEDELDKVEKRVDGIRKGQIFNSVLEDYKDTLAILKDKKDQIAIMEMQSLITEKVNDLVNQEEKYQIPEEIKAVYKTKGGTPHLDTNYTIFGEIIEDLSVVEKMASWFGKKYGLDVLDAIASVPTDKRNRPLKDVRMVVKILHEEE